MLAGACDLKLFEEGSPADLVCRGFGQEYILSETGIDVGYHAAALRSELSGVDRMAYKRLHVVERVSDDVVSSALHDYGAAKIGVDGVLSRLGLANPNITKLKKLFGGTSWEALFRETDRSFRRHNMVRGFAEGHDGVDNPFKLAEYQAKATDTRIERYGGAYTLSSDSSLSEDARESFREHMRDDAFKEHVMSTRRASCLEHYGVDHPMKSDEVKARVAETTLERYGVEHYAQLPESREARSKYLKENADKIRERREETCLERYGVANWSQTEEARLAQSERMRANWKQVDEKMRATMLERYGAQFAGQTQQHHDAMRRMWDERHDSIVNKTRVTNSERYGADYFMQTEEFREHQSAIMRHDWMRRAGIVWDRQHDNVTCGVGCFGSSSPELVLLSLLYDVFGEDDVVWQYTNDARYPHSCDFYIKSRDLFVELNGTWTHGGHWFGSDARDESIARMWLNKGTKYYAMAYETWCERDVEKRACSREHELNYVVLWDGSEHLSDARLWIAMGCPDGRDWEHEYTWLPHRELDLSFDKPLDTSMTSFCIRAARWANGRVFFERECALWDENAYQRAWGTLQAQLYANRYRYLGSSTSDDGQYMGKLPDELSDVEIVRGLGIMGKVRAYTTFDTTAMREVVSKYGVTSVLDVCAGWGERLAFACVSDIRYLGVDVNDKLMCGYDKIVDAYGDADKQRCICDDAAKAEIDGVFDAVITCPPYGDIEHYSDAGAENLSAEEFLLWWSDVVGHVSEHVERLFCVQTNQAYKHVFFDGLVSHGWELCDTIEVPRRVSHLSRKRGGVVLKREFEEMLVFKRECD